MQSFKSSDFNDEFVGGRCWFFDFDGSLHIELTIFIDRSTRVVVGTRGGELVGKDTFTIKNTISRRV